ncbi:MAG: rod shape-determining protein MreC [Pseudomonadota bacterium]
MEILGENSREGLGRKTPPRITMIVFLVASLFLLLSSFYTAEASIFKKARASVLDAAAPILSVLSAPINGVSNVVGEVHDYFDVVEENRALRQENAELRQWMEEALALRDVVAVYEGLQTYQPAPETRPIDAHVIGDSNDAFVKSMVVNAGARNRVKEGFAVVNEAGLVGRIIDVSRRASRVLLLTDIQSRVPVYVDGAELEGILTGRSRQRPTITFTRTVLEDPVREGAAVFTSGAGGVIPRGLPVGQVARIDDDAIEIDLYADYTQTRLVRILDYQFPVTLSNDDEAPDGADPPTADTPIANAEPQ